METWGVQLVIPAFTHLSAFYQCCSKHFHVKYCCFDKVVLEKVLHAPREHSMQRTEEEESQYYVVNK